MNKTAAQSVLAFLLLPAALAASCWPVCAQQGDRPIRLETDLVAIDVTVTDRNGDFIRDLTADDFVLYEDNHPQPFDFFEASQQQDLSRPIAAVFALDTSGSIKPEEVVKQREAVESFMKLVRRDSVFAVAEFNSEFRVVQSFTSDPQKISRAFDKLGKPEGNSRIFASLDKSISLLKRAPRFREGRRVRRVVIVISDGYDNVDRPDEQGPLIRRANDEEVTIYSITLPSYVAGLGPGQRVMTLLDVSHVVPKTGGKDFSADSRDFEPVFRAIAEEIRHGYTLAFYPSEKSRRDGRLHQLRVEVKRPGAIVRQSRVNYQAPR